MSGPKEKLTFMSLGLQQECIGWPTFYTNRWKNHGKLSPKMIFEIEVKKLAKFGKGWDSKFKEVMEMPNKKFDNCPR